MANIIDFEFNIINCTCKISLTYTPDIPNIDKTISFFDVGNISVKRYHEPEDNCLGDFDGITACCLDKMRSEFSINTGDCLVKFEARTEYETTEITS